MYKIRRAIPQDLLYLAHVDQQSFPEPLKKEHLELFLNNRIVLVTTFWGTPVAYLMARSDQMEVRINRFAVKPQHRGNGLAAELIHTLTTGHPDKYITCTVPETWVYANDCRLGHWFNRLQFQAQKPIRNHYEEQGEDGICFLLERPAMTQRKYRPSARQRSTGSPGVG